MSTTDQSNIVTVLRSARANDNRPSAPGADLRGADLSGADLRGANLWGANLWGANLSGANLPQSSVVRALGDTPSGLALIQPTPEGWRMSVGCWRGTPDGLRTLITKDDGWPEARGDQVTERRPFLENVLALAEWHMAKHPKVIDELAAKWGTPDGAVEK